MTEFCSFASGTWEFDQFDDTGHLIYGPVLVCDTHGAPAAAEVYDCDPGQEVGLCQPEAKYIYDHTGFHGQDLIGREASVDETRCRCGRPVAACAAREYATEALSHFATVQAEKVPG